MKRCVIVGATSAIGTALAHQLAEQGNALVLAARDQEELQRIQTDLQIRYGTPVEAVHGDFMQPNFDANRWIGALGEFDSLYMLAGDMGADTLEAENAQRVITINFTIPAAILMAAAAAMEKKQQGLMVVVSSVAGDRGRRYFIPYGSAKAGLSALASGLRCRMAESKVHVMTVKPGYVDTPMTFAINSRLAASPEFVASKILRAAKRRKNSCYVPWFWRYIMLIIIHLPEMIFKRVKI